MKSFTVQLLGASLFSTPILALALKAAPVQPLPPTLISTAEKETVTHPVFRSRDWVGASLINIEPNENYTYVECRFRIPHVKVPAYIPEKQTGEWQATTACGLDGNLNQNAFLNVGVNGKVTRDEQGKDTATYSAIAGWYPSPDVPFPVTVKAGDEVFVSVQGLSATTSRCTFKNLSTGKSGQLSVNATGPENALDGSSADFVVARPFKDVATTTFFDLADWDTVEITHIQAKTQLHNYNLNTAPHSNVIDMVDPTTLAPLANATDPSATTMKAIFVETS